MDNNNPIPAPKSPTTNISPNPAQPTAPQNKAVLWFVIGLVIIILLVGGIYLFLSKQQAAKTTDQAMRQPIVQNTPKPEDTIDALDRDLSAVNAENIDSDFTSIDQDLQQL